MSLFRLTSLLGLTAVASENRLSCSQVARGGEGRKSVMAESRVSLEELTEAAFSGVFRALEARKIAPADREKFLPGPILVGIIWWPERLPGELPFPVSEASPPAERKRR